jgi:hypothetical protein
VNETHAAWLVGASRYERDDDRDACRRSEIASSVVGATSHAHAVRTDSTASRPRAALAPQLALAQTALEDARPASRRRTVDILTEPEPSDHGDRQHVLLRGGPEALCRLRTSS